MFKNIIFIALVLILVGCAKPNGNLRKFSDAADEIQSFAEKNITSEWFMFVEPVGKIVVTDSVIKKTKVLDGDDRSAQMTVLLKGYYTPMGSTDEKEKKQFKLTKRFKVTLETYGQESHFSVELVE
jgi:hypothetical protein